MKKVTSQITGIDIIRSINKSEFTRNLIRTLYFNLGGCNTNKYQLIGMYCLFMAATLEWSIIARAGTHILQ